MSSDRVKFEPSREHMEFCRQEFLTKGGTAGIKWFTTAAVFTTAMSLIWPAYRTRFNWRGQLFCTMGAGIAGFWVRGEEAVVRCHHLRDAERIKDIMEGRTMG